MRNLVQPAHPIPFGSPQQQPSPSSVRLSCSSPGGRAVHSLSVISTGIYCIETHSLPLNGTVDTDQSNHVETIPATIRTRLPQRLCSALSRYPAIELLCVGAASPSQTTMVKAQLPSLCLYTRKDVFLIDIQYEATTAGEVEGQVSNILEPYEEILMGNSTTNILRIRQAPQQHNGYAVLCPNTAMAMLTHNPSANEFCLCIYHGCRSSSTSRSVGIGPTPHYFRMEEVLDPNQQISDFCFCQSTELSLLSSLTVAFLRESGEVHFATPIVFHGAVASSQTVAESLEFLNNSLNESEPNTPTWRQFRIAKQFFIDAFPNYGGSNFVTLGGMRSEPSSEAFNWPVRMQGPILLPPQLNALNYGTGGDSHGTAKIIEPFVTEGDLVGLSIGHWAKMAVDFAVVSPSSFVPRFELETPNDAYKLDEALTIGQVVNHVDLGSSISIDGDSIAKDIKLIVDPIMKDVVHCMTPTQVVSISTNSTRLASNNVHRGDTRLFSPPSKRRDLRPKTTAWKCFDAIPFEGRHDPIVGAVVSDDVQLGHTLVVRLYSGNMIVINLTETRHLRELENFSDSEQIPAIPDASSNRMLVAKSQDVAAIDQTKALSQIVKPFMQEIFKGIGALAQVGGSSTAQEDVSPDILAGFIAIESKCKQEIFVPLMAMNEHVATRKAEFRTEIVRRKKQLDELKKMIGSLQDRQSIIKEKTDIMLDNSKSLADRSNSVLQSSKDFFPKLTQAEYDYFQELKRLNEKSKIWESRAEILSRKISSLNDSTNVENRDPLILAPQHIQSAGQILMASGHLLNKHERTLKLAGDGLERLISIAGSARDQ